MRSRRPYLLRAMYEWMVDAHQTPHVLVDARQDGVAVPAASVHEGRIVLNLGPSAVHHLVLGNQTVEFDARFGGVSHHVIVPLSAVLAIYARESGEGMMFGLEDETPVERPAMADQGGSPIPRQPNDENGNSPAKPTPDGKRRPSLKLVK